MDQLTTALEKVKAQMTNPEEEVMATATKKKAPTKRVKETAATNGHDETEAAEAAPKKSTAKKKVTKSAETDSDLVTLKDLCKELKMETRVARRYLRADKIPNPGRWAWKTGSADLKKVRESLTA